MVFRSVLFRSHWDGNVENAGKAGMWGMPGMRGMPGMPEMPQGGALLYVGMSGM